jgi:hypothetical protein
MNVNVQSMNRNENAAIFSIGYHDIKGYISQQVCPAAGQRHQPVKGTETPDSSGHGGVDEAGREYTGSGLFAQSVARSR